ncbi:MAG: hypothetical protein U9M98_00475 [Patescibacteria group bacterium]|nr:hypothetical protein [Patescibacteria group bacterium]
MKKTLPFLLLLLIFSTFVYAFTLAPGLVWDPVDVGTLLASISSSRFFSYSFSPLYFLVGRFLFFLSGCKVASIANLFSLFSAVLTQAVFYITLREVTKKDVVALFGALFLSVFPFFWQYALYANYYIVWTAVAWLFLFFVFTLESVSKLTWQLLLGCGLFFALALAAFPLSVFLSFPLLLIFVEQRRMITRNQVLIFFSSFVIPLLFIFGAATQAGVSLEAFFGSLVPVDPLLQTAEANLVSLAKTIFPGFYWIVIPFAAVGFLFGEEGVRGVSKFLIVFLVTPVLYTFAVSEGAYLLLVTFIVFWAALGFGSFLDLIWKVSDTEIGTAVENKFFVLVFRLKKEAQALKIISLSLLGGLALLLCFYSFPEHWRELNRANDGEAENYVELVEGRVGWPSLVFSPENSRYISALRYLEAINGEKSLVVTYPAAGLDSSEVLRLRTHHPELKVPDFLGFAQTSAAANSWLRKLVAWNKDEFSIFLTLDKVSAGVGREVGEWEGFSLVTYEPLYKLEP